MTNPSFTSFLTFCLRQQHSHSETDFLMEQRHVAFFGSAKLS